MSTSAQQMTFQQFQELCHELFPGATDFQDRTNPGPSRPAAAFTCRIKSGGYVLRMSYPKNEGLGVNISTAPYIEPLNIINEPDAWTQLRLAAEQLHSGVGEQRV